MILPADYAWVEKLSVLPKMIVEAIKLYGTHEIAGPGDSPTIMEWTKETGLLPIYSGDEIPWCGLFMAVVAERAGKPVPTSPLWALSWASWGVPAGHAGLGDVMTFVRPGGGHVGLYIAEDKTAYHILGGNTSDQVKIARLDKQRLRAARRPIYKNQPATVQRYVVAPAGELSVNEK